jgi:uncharacterized protein (DUF1810 family)
MSTPAIDLERFLSAQRGCYERVKREMEEGHKQSCWIWYIFPQILIKKSGVSEYHKIYAIRSLAEADAYLKHPVLGARLRELSEIVLTHPKIPINTIMGWSLDAMKFRSSMTLFSLVSPEGSVFHRVIDQFFEGKGCPITLERMGKKSESGSETDPDPDENSEPDEDDRLCTPLSSPPPEKPDLKSNLKSLSIVLEDSPETEVKDNHQDAPEPEVKDNPNESDDS